MEFYSILSCSMSSSRKGQNKNGNTITLSEGSDIVVGNGRRNGDG